MTKLCKLTGVDLETEKCPVKKMCLNCHSLIENEDGSFSCGNEDVMNFGRNKILESVPAGYSISKLELNPMSLKDPTKKCAKYETNSELVENLINELFNN